MDATGYQRSDMQRIESLLAILQRNGPRTMTIRSFGTHESLMERATQGAIANPMRVVLTPEDIAEAVAFFANPAARYITGQTLHVNAGAFMP